VRFIVPIDFAFIFLFFSKEQAAFLCAILPTQGLFFFFWIWSVFHLPFFFKLPPGWRIVAGARPVVFFTPLIPAVC